MANQKGLHPTVAAIAFTVLVPFTMAGVIPWLITRWHFQPALLGVEAGRWIGAAMIAFGATWLLSAIARFAKRMGKPYEDYLKSVPGWIPRRPRP